MGSLCTGILGLDGLTVWPGLCLAGRIAKWQVPWKGSAPTRTGANFPNRETSWPTHKLHKEARAMMVDCNMPDSFFPTLGSDHPEGQRCWADLGGSLDCAPQHQLERTRGCKGLENKRPVYIRHWFLKVFLSSGNWRQIPCRKASPVVCPLVYPEQLWTFHI